MVAKLSLNQFVMKFFSLCAPKEIFHEFFFAIFRELCGTAEKIGEEGAIIAARLFISLSIGLMLITGPMEGAPVAKRNLSFIDDYF